MNGERTGKWNLSRRLMDIPETLAQYEDKTQKHKNTILFPLSEAHDLLMLFVFIYVGCCPMWFPCQMMLISFNFISNKTGFISRSRTAFLTFETDQFLFLTIFYKHAHPNNQPYYYIITFTQCTKIRNYFFDWHEGDITHIVYMIVC